MELRQESVTAGDLDVAYLACGDEGPLAVCLHGFPDSAHTWRHLLPDLAAAGYRAVAPWLRGYAPTSVPAEARWGTGVLALDACALHEALGGDGDAVLIGHDWGAIATYPAVNHAPERWRKAVTLAIPPAGAMGVGFLRYEQLKRSWYIFFFQQVLADLAVPMDDLAFIDRLWSDWSPGYDAADDLPHVKDALRGPANLEAALAYYRAMFGTIPKAPDGEPVEALAGDPPGLPVLYLHGATDGCLGLDAIDLEAAAALLPHPGSRVQVVPGAGHFLHVEVPSVVNAEVVAFLAE